MRYIKVLYYVAMLTFGLGWAFYWVRENHVGGAFAFFLLCLPIVFYLWRVIKKDFLSRNDPQQ